MTYQAYPILEFDPTAEAIIEPSRVLKTMDIAEHCVICFFQDVISALVSSGRARQVTKSVSEMGEHPVYELDFAGHRLTFFHPGVGAALAAGILEETIARGCRKFIACGGCGVLAPDIAVGHLIIPTSAVRDEGTSYHYLPPSREVSASQKGVSALETVLKRHQVEYLLTKTWTTDAIYRETPARARLRIDEGCLTVEMEAAAFFAVAKFRGVEFVQLLYGGDAVLPGAWDSRDWIGKTSVREQLFWLAAEACLEMG